MLTGSWQHWMLTDPMLAGGHLDHILHCPQEGKMTILLLQRERKSSAQNHQNSQMNMRMKRGANILLMKEMTDVMLIIVTRSKLYSLTAKCY
jgi:hypothetical protein